jgi:hypothetical protein
MASTAPSSLTEEDREALEKGMVSSEVYAIGGIVGTFIVPFGVGQAIHGRYLDTGWIFTVGELGSLGLAVAGVLDQKCTPQTVNLGFGTTSYETCTFDTTKFWIGFGAYLGFRIWELLDLWIAPARQNEAYRRAEGKKAAAERRTSYFLAPTSQGNALAAGFQLRF